MTDDEDIGRIRSAIEKEAAASQAKKKVLGDIVKDRVKSGNMAASQGAATPRSGKTSSRGAFTSRFESAISGTMVCNCSSVCLLGIYPTITNTATHILIMTYRVLKEKRSEPLRIRIGWRRCGVCCSSQTTSNLIWQSSTAQTHTQTHWKR